MSSPVACKFVDFWPFFTLESSLLYQTLTKNFDLVLSDDPEYLIYSVFGGQHLFDPRYERCIKVMVTGENVRPNFKNCDYALSFDYLDDPRHLRWPLFAQSAAALVRPSDQDVAAIAAGKTKFCNFLYSNGCCRERNDFFDLLSAYKQVDSGGAVKNNLGFTVGERTRGGYNLASKRVFQSEYKFTIAFENASRDGYVTEKLIDAYAGLTVPIYSGDISVIDDFNWEAFLNYQDAREMDYFVRNVKGLDEDLESYRHIYEQPLLKEEPSLNEAIAFVMNATMRMK